MAQVGVDDRNPAAPALPFWARAALLAVSTTLIAVALWRFGGEARLWAQALQETLNTELARGVRAVRSGDFFALTALLGACFLYGVVHAVGPGHGKLVIGGAAAASRRTAWRMASIGFAASLTQGLVAVLLAYGALGLFSLSGRAADDLARDVLAPLSAAAVVLVGLWIFWRGWRGLAAAKAPSTCGAGCASGCRHGPTAEETERATGWVETAALIFSIGARPCSGALIVLAIAWNFQLYVAGVLSALAMAVGTGLVVGAVAIAAASFRDAQALRGDDRASRRLFAWVQVCAGLGVAALSALFVLGSV